LTLLLVPALASAEPNDWTGYRAKANDSFGMIASEFYGDRSKAMFILAKNKIERAKPLRQGERLRVPILREITTSPGDTFQSLAETLLGDPLRGGFLAELNHMSPDDNLAAGTPIIIPFTVTHTAASNESITSIAATFYGDGKLADVLRRYNSLDKNTLEKGESITIPSYNLRIHPSKIPAPDSEAKLRRERRKDNTTLADAALPAARHAWRIGDYATVRKTLEPVDLAYLELGRAIEIGVLLASAHVAFGDEEKAREVFKRVIDRKPTHPLRKVDHSPKVLAIWTTLDGLVE
jgi:LysM repeat protein